LLGRLLYGGTTTAATNIDTETTSDTASVSTKLGPQYSVEAEETKQEVVEALSKITEEHATPSPPVNLAVEVSPELKSEASQRTHLTSSY
jgi:hypothetical protein